MKSFCMRVIIQREREGDRQTETDRDKDRETQTDRQTETERNTQRDRQTLRDRDRQRQRYTRCGISASQYIGFIGIYRCRLRSGAPAAYSVSLRTGITRSEADGDAFRHMATKTVGLIEQATRRLPTIIIISSKSLTVK